jgi:hypothetical protein
MGIHPSMGSRNPMILRYVFQAGEVLKWIAQKNNYI